MRIKHGIVIFVLAAVVAMVVPLSLSAAGSDNYPNGCVSCHTGDRVVPNMLLKIQGHPHVASFIKNVPTDCHMCHKEGAPKAPLLVVAIHTVHGIPLPHKGMTAADFTGKCLNCHAVDAAGNVSIKSGPKNW